MTKRSKGIEVTVDYKAFKTLVRLARDSNASCIAEVLRNAVALLEWSRVQERAGYTVGCFKDGEPAKAVTLPFKNGKVVV